MLIRPARPADATALAGVHIASWQRAYRGLLPDAYLDGLDADRWTTRWEAALAEGDWPRRGTVVAESPSGGVIGFLDVVPSRHEPDRGQQLTASTAWSSAP